MSPSLTISPLEDNPNKKLKHLLADAWASNTVEVESILNEFVRQQVDDTLPRGASAEDAVAALNTARHEERIIDDLSKILPECEDIERLPRWWRQCLRYMSMFELVEVREGCEMEPQTFNIKCSRHMQQRIGACIFAKLQQEVQHCVEICATQSPGTTFSIRDVGAAIVAAAQSNSRPAPLEQKVTKESGNLNMWFIMDAWDASSKVMVMGDPINTTLNFLDVYERYLECPALLVLYVQVLRDCSIAAANCLLQDKFMESEMPSVTNVGKYITDSILPLLRVTKSQWDRSASNGEAKSDDGEESNENSARNLHWSRAKRCFGCGSAEHALNNCSTVPPHCTLEELEKIRANAVVPPGYKWRTAKTVLKMHKYSAVARNKDKTEKDSDPDDSYIV